MAEHYPERFDAFISANASLPVGTHISPTHLKWRQDAAAGVYLLDIGIYARTKATLKEKP